MNINSTKSIDLLQGICDCIKFYTTDTLPLPYPAIYSLELTPACNNRCPGCGNVFASPETLHATSLQLAQWHYILNTIAPYAQRLTITGGEPTLHPDFADIIHTIDERGIPFTLFTNGRWQKPESIISLLRQTAMCSGLLVSLHGAVAPAHEAFTGVVGSFAETIANMQLATQAGLRVHTNTVLTRANAHQIDAIVHLSQSLGASQAVFNRYIGKAIPELDLPHAMLLQALNRISSLARETSFTKIGTCIPLCFAETSATSCGAGSLFCTIDPWGYVRPCNHAPHIAGNLLHESLETVWQSDVLNQWREMVPSACANCDAFATCRGGCRAEAVLQGVQEDPLMVVA